MNATLRQVAHHLFEQHDLNKIQVEELDYLIEEYPYFSAFHILKAKKMMAERDQSSNQALQKAAIFFHNPHWLDYQMHHDEPFSPHEEHLSEILTTPDSEILPELETDEILPEAEIEIEANEVLFDNKRAPFTEPVLQPDNRFGSTTETGEVPDTELTFDPLHTVDYFASQGIKIPAEITEQDQLSIKLKSFTEWLRSMKRLHPEKFQYTSESVREKEQIPVEAASPEDEVITEAMAEVYALQGLKEKAIGVYEKLSLLEPQKSDYFALRIKDLK